MVHELSSIKLGILRKPLCFTRDMGRRKKQKKVGSNFEGALWGNQKWRNPNTPLGGKKKAHQSQGQGEWGKKGQGRGLGGRFMTGAEGFGQFKNLKGRQHLEAAAAARGEEKRAAASEEDDHSEGTQEEDDHSEGTQEVSEAEETEDDLSEGIQEHHEEGEGPDLQQTPAVAAGGQVPPPIVPAVPEGGIEEDQGFG